MTALIFIKFSRNLCQMRKTTGERYHYLRYKSQYSKVLHLLPSSLSHSLYLSLSLSLSLLAFLFLTWRQISGYTLDICYVISVFLFPKSVCWTAVSFSQCSTLALLYVEKVWRTCSEVLSATLRWLSGVMDRPMRCKITRRWQWPAFSLKIVLCCCLVRECI